MPAGVGFRHRNWCGELCVLNNSSEAQAGQGKGESPEDERTALHQLS